MVTSLGIVLVFALLILLQQRFFVVFFAIYIVFAVALNLAWKARWRGISPPHDRREEEEIETTDSFS
jgi:CDP-diacylglycerol--serine O-phosphatidyltransferase